MVSERSFIMLHFWVVLTGMFAGFGFFTLLFIISENIIYSVLLSNLFTMWVTVGMLVLRVDFNKYKKGGKK